MRITGLERNVFYFFIALFFASIDSLHARLDETGDTLPERGNFSLPSTQQPSPLLGFGQNIIPEDAALIFLVPTRYQGAKVQVSELIPIGIYGIRDNFSVLLSVPAVLRDKDGDTTASGFPSALLQFEYAPYENQTSTFVEQWTLVGNISIPTGADIDKRLATGFNASSAFVGTTFARTYEEWLFFASDGVTITIPYQGESGSNTLLYQAGLGKNIYSVPSEHIFAGLLGVDGVYTGKAKYDGIIDPDSGGNTLFLTPSLFFSTPKFIAQLGIGIPVVQNLFGNQNKINYLLAANLGWRF